MKKNSTAFALCALMFLLAATGCMQATKQHAQSSEDASLAGKKAVITNVIVFALVPVKGDQDGSMRALMFRNKTKRHIVDSIHQQYGNDFDIEIPSASIDVAVIDGTDTLQIRRPYYGQALGDTLEIEPQEAAVFKSKSKI